MFKSLISKNRKICLWNKKFGFFFHENIRNKRKMRNFGPHPDPKQTSMTAIVGNDAHKLKCLVKPYKLTNNIIYRRLVNHNFPTETYSHPLLTVKQIIQKCLICMANF